VFKKREKVNMSDDLVKRLRSPANVFYEYAADGGAFLREAASRIEKLEAALEKIAQHDIQAVAMDALRPGERIRGRGDE
jgi:hypothetical protein